MNDRLIADASQTLECLARDIIDDFVEPSYVDIIEGNRERWQRLVDTFGDDHGDERVEIHRRLMNALPADLGEQFLRLDDCKPTSDSWAKAAFQLGLTMGMRRGGDREALEILESSTVIRAEIYLTDVPVHVVFGDGGRPGPDLKGRREFGSLKAAGYRGGTARRRGVARSRLT